MSALADQSVRQRRVDVHGSSGSLIGTVSLTDRETLNCWFEFSAPATSYNRRGSERGKPQEGNYQRLDGSISVICQSLVRKRACACRSPPSWMPCPTSSSTSTAPPRASTSSLQSCLTGTLDYVHHALGRYLCSEPQPRFTAAPGDGLASTVIDVEPLVDRCCFNEAPPNKHDG